MSNTQQAQFPDLVLVDGQVVGVVLLILALFPAAFALGYFAGMREGLESKVHATSNEIPRTEVLMPETATVPRE